MCCSVLCSGGPVFGSFAFHINSLTAQNWSNLLGAKAMRRSGEFNIYISVVLYVFLFVLFDYSFAGDVRFDIYPLRKV